MIKFCCENMEYYLNLIDLDLVHYSEVFDEYGIPCHEDGGHSSVRIKYCPWCGKRLPESKRDEWFDRLEKLGFDDPLFDENIPIEYKTSKWRE